MDMQNPIADIVENQFTIDRRSRVPFEELCAFYAALKWDAAIAVVAQASGLNVSTIAHLNAAGERRGGQIRYPKVRAEFVRLGLEKFSTAYLTAPIRDRLRVATEHIREKRAEPSAIARAGVNPRAIKDRGRHAIKDPSGGPDTPIEIAFDYGPKPGWKWRAPSDEAAQSWRGDPRHEERGFATSADVKAFCQTRFGPSDDEIIGGASELATDDSYFWANRP